MLWILDAGHGIETAGKRSPGKRTSDDGRPGIVEYQFNRDVVWRIAEALESIDVPCHVICQDEHTKPIKERVRLATVMLEEWEGQGAFISVHANAAGPGGWFEGARGVRVFTKMNAGYPSTSLATMLCDSISKFSGLRHLGTRDHITRKGKKVNLGVLAPLPCPAVLTENGFMTSRGDCEILESDKGRQAIAEGHIQAIINFQDKINGTSRRQN